MTARTQWWVGLIGLLVLAAPAQADIVEYMHTDLAGSVVAVTDQSGNVIERREYEPYGLPRTPVADGPGYTGHDHDPESGLVYMQQRYYDPEVGRFLSIDPVGVSPGGGNFNRYWYANNNPYTLVDPDGREADCADKGCQLEASASPQARKGLKENKQLVQENKASAQSRWDRANLHNQSFSDVPAGGWTPASINSTLLTGGGIAATAGQATLVNNGQWYSARNNRWYSLTWGGNGSTLTRASVLARFDKIRLFAQRSFFLSAGIDGFQFIDALSSNDYATATNAMANISASAAFTFGGGPGAVGGVTYFGTSIILHSPSVYDVTVTPIANGLCSISGDC